MSYGPPTYSAPAACRVAGLSYRQVDHLARTGIIAPTIPCFGSGTQRGYSIDELVWLRAAHYLARSGIGSRGEIPTGLLQQLRGRIDTTIVAGPVQLHLDIGAIRREVLDRIAELRLVPQQRERDLAAEAGRRSLPPMLRSLAGAAHA